MAPGVLLSFLLFFFQAASTTPAAGAVREGLAAYAQKDYQKTIQLLTPVVPKLKPDTPAWNEAVLALGQSHYFLAQYAEAAPFIELRRERRSRPELDYMLATTYLFLSQPAKARPLFAALFAAPPDSATAYFLTAQQMVRNGIQQPARPVLEQALALDPKLPGANLMLAELLQRANDAAAARKHLDAEVAAWPASAGAWHQLGEWESRQHHYPEAIRALQKSIWLNPYTAAPYLTLARAYQQVKSLSNAENMARKALELEPANKTAQAILDELKAPPRRKP